MTESTALITNDAVVFGLLVVILAAIFHTSGSDRPGWRRFYAIVPTVRALRKAGSEAVRPSRSDRSVSSSKDDVGIPCPW